MLRFAILFELFFTSVGLVAAQMVDLAHSGVLEAIEQQPAHKIILESLVDRRYHFRFGPDFEQPVQQISRTVATGCRVVDDRPDQALLEDHFHGEFLVFQLVNQQIHFDHPFV